MATKIAMKRIHKEIADAQDTSMRDLGIYYWYNEADVRQGRAMILGPEGTPYAHCPLVFSIQLPDDYPFTSPKVQILSSDGVTRFHPNLYINGKVCLSILGTWSGPAWASSMSISTVLKSIHSLLEDNPIVNEPSWESVTLADPRAAGYAAWVKWRLVAYTVGLLNRWRRGHVLQDHLWYPFSEILTELAPVLQEKLGAIIAAESQKGERSYERLTYSMGGRTEWNRLIAQLKIDP